MQLPRVAHIVATQRVGQLGEEQAHRVTPRAIVLSSQNFNARGCL